MSQRRITIVNNSNPDQAKILIIPLNLAIQQFLLLATQKLSFKARKLYLPDGAEVDDCDYLHDGDVLYVSSGEPFFKQTNKRKEPHIPTLAVAVMGPGSVGKVGMSLPASASHTSEERARPAPLTRLFSSVVAPVCCEERHHAPLRARRVRNRLRPDHRGRVPQERHP